MNSKTIVKLALSSAVIAIPTVGCASIDAGSTKGLSSAKGLSSKASTNANKAETFLDQGNLDKAERFAERAVEGEMTNANHRALLARIYMAKGKFKSAERTLTDVMDLGVRDPRTVVSLALTRIAQGNVNAAVSLLESNRDTVSDSDMGLALALAGKSQRSVDLLMAAARRSDATARTRQNLALAMALNGQWPDARAVASQDLSQSEVNNHIAQWAQFARPGAYQKRVAGLLNVTPQSNDTGQPVRLALANTAQGLASAASQPTSSPVNLLDNVGKGELAAVGPAPISTSVGFAAAENNVKMAPQTAPAMEAPLIKAPKAPVKSAAKAPVKKPFKAKPVSKTKPVKLAIANVRPKNLPSVTGTHIVQLGAFSSRENAKKAWSKYKSDYSILQGFQSASSTVKVNGKSLVRLAAMGFGNKSAAQATCNKIKANGGSCIVRSVGKRAPVRLAMR